MELNFKVCTGWGFRISKAHRAFGVVVVVAGTCYATAVVVVDYYYYALSSLSTHMLVHNGTSPHA